MSRRVVVGGLGGAAASLAAIVGAVSLTRIAGGYLGFPPGLEWTLTGAVDIAGIAGGIMWTAFDGRVRKIGRPMNIVCTLVSGVGVGLDHATHAVGGPVWPWVAFCAGLFIPALAAWILHSLAVIADFVSAPSASGHQPIASQTATAGQAGVAKQAVIARVGDRQDTTIVTASLAVGDRQALTVGDQAGNRQVDSQAGHRQPANRQGSDRQAGGAGQPASPASRQPGRSPAPATARPARPLASVPEPRLPWMTDELIAAVVEARRADSTYGRGQIVADHKIGAGQARSLIDYINRHGLMRESA